MQIHNWKALDESARRQLLTRPALSNDASVQATAAEIIEQVRTGGDAAVKRLTAEIDGISIDSLSVAAEEFEEASSLLSEAERDAIASAAQNICAFHEAQRPGMIEVQTRPGVVCERVTRPIRSVGLYVPAGAAPLPSTALMLGIPARIAGCPSAVLCSPVQANGKVSPAVLFAAQVAGVERVFKAGGAQAIAAMAYGTETIPKADKLFGPGNAWVTAAKSQVSRDPLGAALDLPAGPSEVLVIADEKANPLFVATDLLSQAEHGPDSQVILITNSERLAKDVLSEIEGLLTRLSRRDAMQASLQNSSVFIVEDMETAIEISNTYAPEHLIIQAENPRHFVPRIYTAGSVFLGPWAPESLGDYCSGTNHVLPTYGFARAYSGLGVSDFLRSMTLQEVSRDGMREIGPTALSLATLEGLDAHAEAVRVRLDALEGASS